MGLKPAYKQHLWQTLEHSALNTWKFKCLVSDRMKRTYWNSKSWSHEANEESHSLHVFQISKRTIINSRMLGFGGFSFRKHYWKKKLNSDLGLEHGSATSQMSAWTHMIGNSALSPPPIPLPGLGCLALTVHEKLWKVLVLFQCRIISFSKSQNVLQGGRTISCPALMLTSWETFLALC